MFGHRGGVLRPTRRTSLPERRLIHGDGIGANRRRGLERDRGRFDFIVAAGRSTQALVDIAKKSFLEADLL
jgi:hypothetical protein